MIQLRNELLQGEAGLLKVVLVDGVEAGVCSRRYQSLWTISRGIGEAAVLLESGVRGRDLVARVALNFDPNCCRTATTTYAERQRAAFGGR
jgi:hypothetical protein